MNFLSGQIGQIEQYTLASVLCDALPGVEVMQPRALLQPFDVTPE